MLKIISYKNSELLAFLLSWSEMELIEQDQEFVALSRQFKATAMELISILEQVKFEASFSLKYFPALLNFLVAQLSCN